MVKRYFTGLCFFLFCFSVSFAEGENPNPTPNETEPSATNDQMSSSESTDKSDNEENPESEPQNRDITYEHYHLFQNGVTEIVVTNSSSEFYVAGNDGFVTRYKYPQLQPDTWQLSDISIKKMALHPNQKHLAIYESNGLSDHRISVWDWNKKECLFTKKLDNSVLSLVWSAKGTYLFVGNTSMDGIYVFNLNGKKLDIFDVPPGIVLLSATGPSEKSVITYGETGRLVYTNLKNKQMPIQYPTEAYLKSPELIRNFTQIIGYKGKQVFVIDALSGETLKTYHAVNPIFACKLKDKVPLWIDSGSSANNWCIRQGNAKTPDFKLPYRAKPVAARHVGNHIAVGTNTGRVFLLNQTADSKITFSEIPTPNLNQILDIDTDGQHIFFLTKNKIKYINNYNDAPKLLTDVKNVNKLKIYKDGLLLWSNKKTTPVYYFSFKTNKKKIIYHPKETITSLSIYEDKITMTEYFSGVTSINLNTGSCDFCYSATGIQDAVQIDKTYMLVTKSSIDKNKTPVFLINTKTGETLPFPVEGEFAFSLTRDDLKYNELSCFVINTINSENITELFTITVNTKKPAESKFKKILAYKTEDLNAFVASSKKQILTNLGGYSLIYHNKNTQQTISLMRTYTLTNKAIFTNNYILSLNDDGSVLWYDRENLNAVAISTLEY
ncbi:MAG: hypothetical protein CR988_04825 [Treponema sp.]|nr:MAG: hypothetical protein CR988_04825 [Treponema sp.]